jgi:hypothetical protein
MWTALSDEKSGLHFSFLPGIASAAFLRSESHCTHEHSLLSPFLRLPQPGGQVPVFISPKSKSHYDRQSVLLLGPRPGLATNSFFLLDIFFRHLRVWYFVASSLTRGRVCNLLLLLVLASAVTLGLPSLTRVRSRSHTMTYVQSASSSWRLASFGSSDEMLHLFEWQLLSLFSMYGALSGERKGL